MERLSVRYSRFAMSASERHEWQLGVDSGSSDVAHVWRRSARGRHSNYPYGFLKTVHSGGNWRAVGRSTLSSTEKVPGTVAPAGKVQQFGGDSASLGTLMNNNE